MKKSSIYLSPPYVGHEERAQLLKVLEGGWIAPVGPSLDAFESALEAKFGYGKVLCLNSGTAALHLALRITGIKRGDKVVVGSFTFCAAANAVLYEGGVPVFMDSEATTWNLDPALLENYLENSPGDERPKAVVLTHIYGIPARVEEISSVCRKFGVRLIEDAAEALGASANGCPAGKWGDFGVLSFNGNKIITTGGGGALVCHGQEHYDRALFLSTQAKDRAPYYAHSELGYNYRMSNVLAGIGLGQLQKLDYILKRKKEIFDFYAQHLGGSGLFEFPEEPASHRSSRWLSCFLIRKAFLSRVSPQEIVGALAGDHIEARRFWKPLHLQPLYRGSSCIGGGISEDLFDRGVCLPSGVALSLADQERVVGVIRDLLSSRGLL